MKKVVIYSTYELSHQEIDKLVEKIPSLKNYQIVNQVDKSLIAGLVIKFADRIIDLSIKGRLNNISKKLYEET
ncbi:MAG: F0F1 ATP synthase subunit delta [Patescibacteria group bacterium]|nr:F0F1 ATP synthase subunit delta [Patescibacteria group bacterium]